MQLIKKYFCILLCSSFVLVSFPIYSSAESNNLVEKNDFQENYTYLLKNPKQTKEVLEIIKKQSPSLNTTAIEDIGLIYVENSKNADVSKIENKIIKYIDDKGELPNLIPPYEDTISPNKIPNEAKKPILNDSKKFNQFNTNIKSPSLNSKSFMPFNWYLEDLTSDYKSLSIDKGEHSTIALIDSGVDMEHPLIKRNIDLTLAKNYVTDEMDITDELGHGTTIAGIISNVAPQTKIVPYKVVGTTGGESVWVIDAIIDAANNDSDVINLSVGTYFIKSEKEDKLLIKAYKKAVKYAKSKGSVVIASAGNDGFDLDELKELKFKHLPGGLHNVVTVSSNTKNNNLAYYSNFGKEVDFSAPGGSLFDENGFDNTNEMIITTFPINKMNTSLDQSLGIPQGYTLTEGTSYSVPQVSATAALIISEYIERTGNQPSVKRVLKYLEEGSADIGEPGRDNYFGEGKVNAYNSLRMMNK
ncbi:S8 family serine peptidase [Priestia filamentosa]|uniref:S8 family serine peptidase n=1 Tax=Priestia filamentosa TaxID=1402861 RepID=UPI003F18222A